MICGYARVSDSVNNLETQEIILRTAGVARNIKLFGYPEIGGKKRHKCAMQSGMNKNLHQIKN